MSGDDLAVEAGVEEARPAGEQDVVCRGDLLYTPVWLLSFCWQLGDRNIFQYHRVNIISLFVNIISIMLDK